ncbi:MAG TPA: helix-turn-helix transcriptional regulator [Mycobacteriales bacterium]|nr:helix-turn-helix transcriptional regulator [Mycobacteriales bacterium]
MAVEPDPSVQRKLLRGELRRARNAAGLRQADVAAAMDWSPSKLIRIESGDVRISTNDLRALLAHYDVKDKTRVTSLLELAKSSRTGSFYDQFAADLKEGFRDYLAFEASASVIRQYEPILISGLLQTEEYAREILLHAGGFGTEKADRLWTIRQHRQELHDREDAPEMRFVIDEASIARQVGRNNKTMTRQIERLREFAGESHIKLRVLPLTVGANPGMLGSFALLEFDDPNLDDLVHLESVDEVTIKDDSEKIAEYGDRFQTLEELSLSEEDSKTFLEEYIDGRRGVGVRSAAEVAG